MHEILILLQWLMAFLIAGLCGSFVFISNDSSKMLRYAVGKSLGIISLATITWILSLAKILPFTTAGTWLILLLIVGFTLYYRHKFILKFIKENIRQILIIELIVLGLFFIVLATRMLSSKIEGIEKFMDMALLTGLMRHRTGVPIDTWFAPDTINYYYFGHWIVATLAKLSMVPANYAFNLGFASIISVAGGVIYAIIHKLTGKIWAGFLGIFLTLFASNMYIFISYLGFKTIFFFSSGRFVDNVINEYPFYSIILGDLHAHVLALILSTALFGLLVIAAGRKTNVLSIKEYVLIGFLLGLMGSTNSFDIINSSVLLGIFFCWEYFVRKLGFKQILKAILAIFIPFVIFLAIFMISFSIPVGGIQISLFKTPLIHIFWQFGLCLILLVASFVAIGLQPKSRDYFNNFVKSYRFLIIIFAVSAIALILFTEIVYLKDILHDLNRPYARANTQFKIWFSAWIMLAIAATAAFAEAMNFVKSSLQKKLLKILLIYIIIIATVGTVTGYRYINNMHKGNTLAINGTQYLETYDPYKLQMINYVNKNISGQPVILQYGGNSYSINSWLSAYTGTSSYLGWLNHEATWRYGTNKYKDVQARFENIKNAYEPHNLNELKDSLHNINAKYMIIGPDERNIYSVRDDIIRPYLGKPIYLYAGYELYRVPQNNR